jgi:hypothetical protein
VPTLERISPQDQTKYAGRWVAVKQGKVLVAADDPQAVSDWLQKNAQAADFVYRVAAQGEPSNWVY